MWYGILADFVLAIHFGFIVFVLLGGLVAARFAWIAILHLAAAGWGVWVELTGRICPLTPLENTLRHRAGEAGYPGSFIEHYLLPVVYPAGLTRNVQLALGATVIAVNALVYAWVVLRWRARARAKRRSRSAIVG
jgi:hypothetical protein